MDGRKILKRVLAVLLAIPMLVLLFGCATENELGIREKENKDMLTFDAWGLTIMSSGLNNWIHLNGEEGSQFICSTSTQDIDKEGSFTVDDPLTEGFLSVSVESGTIVLWSCHASEGFIKTDKVWLEFINRKDDHIIGYAVVRADRIAEYYFEPTLVKAVTFPKVFGKYQEVTEDQVNLLIKNAEK